MFIFMKVQYEGRLLWKDVQIGKQLKYFQSWQPLIGFPKKVKEAFCYGIEVQF